MFCESPSIVDFRDAFEESTILILPSHAQARKEASEEMVNGPPV